MWFKSKPKNRRLDPRFVLEVKVRSDQIRAARWRLAHDDAAGAQELLSEEGEDSELRE